LDKHKLISLVSKYRYVLIVVAVGLVLMLLPGSGGKEPEPTQQVQETVPDLEAELAGILSKIKGAGKVEVMLTTAQGQETCYQTDRRGEDHSTVTVTDGSRIETGLIRQVNPPVYLGAIIVCQGGDDPSVRLAIVESVAKATGLGADRISVMKMK
jgi:stage III sporulation protein AG